MEEIWKDVEGFNGYQVSNLGRVMTFKNTHSVISDKGRLMNVFARFGYNAVKLTNNKDDSNSHYVHILIANAFIPIYKQCQNVLFINGNTLDCKLNNLFVIEINKVYPDGEIWRNVNGFENKYYVSNFGRVISNVGNTKFLNPIKNSNGYFMFRLSKDNLNVKNIPLHRLIAEAFIPNPENKPTINHRNGIKIDNSLDNIEWATYLENNQHAIDTGLRKPTFNNYGRKGKYHPKSVAVIQFTMDYKFVKHWDCIADAAKSLRINHSHISSCASHKYGRKSSGGYRWEFSV